VEGAPATEHPHVASCEATASASEVFVPNDTVGGCSATAPYSGGVQEPVGKARVERRHGPKLCDLFCFCVVCLDLLASIGWRTYTPRMRGKYNPLFFNQNEGPFIRETHEHVQNTTLLCIASIFPYIVLLLLLLARVSIIFRGK
jgi:hypothetical protein